MIQTIPHLPLEVGGSFRVGNLRIYGQRSTRQVCRPHQSGHTVRVVEEIGLWMEVPIGRQKTKIALNSLEIGYPDLTVREGPPVVEASGSV